MNIDLASGLLKQADYLPSPNYDERESGEVSLCVIHNISLPPNEFGGPGIVELFTNQLNSKAHPYYEEIHHLRVSSHLLIRRDGQLIQFVPFHKRAWHAGVSCFEGREKCNEFSVGIELEGSDTQAFEAVQYQQLADVLKALMHAYPSITPERITGHSDIAPGRKTDPGPFFYWEQLRTLLEKHPDKNISK